MATLFNQTNINKDTSLFITRAEVIQGLSTLAGDLSGANLSTLFYNPNPAFSTISMPATGTIQTPFSLVSQKVALSTTGAFTPGSLFLGNPAQTVCAVDNTGINTGNLAAKGFFATTSIINGSGSTQPKVILSQSGIQALDASSNNRDLALYLPGNPAGQNWALSNISSINGSPATGGNTFTTLTGSNLISQIVNTSQLVGVSSFNGFSYQSPLQQTFSGSNTASLNTGVNTSVFSINLPAGTLVPNRSYMYDFPITIGAIPPSPVNFQLLMGVRLGGNGQFNYSLPYWVASNSFFPVQLNLTGIAQTNTVSINAQVVEVLMVQNSGSTWTAPVYAPTGSGVVNTLFLKNMSS